MFSESSTGSWAELQLPCCRSKQGELPENMLQHLLLNLPPQPVSIRVRVLTSSRRPAGRGRGGPGRDRTRRKRSRRRPRRRAPPSMMRPRPGFRARRHRPRRGRSKSPRNPCVSKSHEIFISLQCGWGGCRTGNGKTVQQASR